MQHAHPIGLALSKPLLDRLDAIARVEGVSRSSVARSFLVKGLAAYEREIGWSDPFAGYKASLSREWRRRLRSLDENASNDC